MAYTLNFFCKCPDLDPAAAIELLTGELAKLQPPVYAGHPSHGDIWAAVSVGSSESAAAAENTLVEFNSDPSIVGATIAEVASEDASGRLRDANALVIVTISGSEIDSAAVRAIWELTTSRWQAVPYDEVSGFEISNEGL